MKMEICKWKMKALNMTLQIIRESQGAIGILYLMFLFVCLFVCFSNDKRLLMNVIKDKRECVFTYQTRIYQRMVPGLLL